MPSPKLRFEVFKRDAFKCQYCGRTPPDIVLELDHITPKANGGKNTTDNYITACFDCNRGKGKNELTVAPPTLDGKIALIKERKKQLRAFNRLLEQQEIEYNQSIDILCDTYSDYFTDKSPSDNFCAVTIKRLVKSLPIQHLIDAMGIACSTKHDDPNAALLYFCGICWNWIKHPETRNW